VSFYSASIEALVSEKFFALCEVMGAKDVGLLTGDASVNPGAPVISVALPFGRPCPW
jgi:superfamily II RNA helicase